MPKTVSNQKTVAIHRDKLDDSFLGIKNANWMEFNKKHNPYALQLYLYLAKNADGFQLALSQQAALEEAGITKTTFHTLQFFGEPALLPGIPGPLLQRRPDPPRGLALPRPLRAGRVRRHAPPRLHP